MKRSLFIVLLCLSVLSCRRDGKPASVFVPDTELHLQYDIFGVERPFGRPLTLSIVNNTEQVTYAFESDLWGRVILSGLLPGQYTVTISGSLTAEETALLPFEAFAGKAAGLAGFIGNMVLRLGEHIEIDPPALSIVSESAIVFKELYYCGSRTPTGGTYRNDSFFSICNNSPDPVDISDLYIAMYENYGGLGETGPLWPGEENGNYKNVYLKSVWKITADAAPVYMQPGQTVVIATMAAPHNQDAAYNLSSPVDLSKADYEAYIPDPGNLYPDFEAPNMELSFWPDYAYLWRSSVFGQGMVLLQATREEFAAFETVTLPETFQDPFENEEYWICKKVPYKYVVDAVDILQNETVTHTKHFSPALDSGFATVGETYCGKSLLRKVLSSTGGRVRLQDTNNSAQDFVINDTPLAL